MASTRVPLEDSECVLHIRRMIPLRKLASTRVPLEDSGMISLRKLASTRVPLEVLRVCSAHAIG
ncbi:hypothetical protein Prudu_377S000400 [Prunus dulcis]|uniref:Uncharacterized protein n=1 Tax=Prunus dulcis TaxID=3755 RepID=A0A5H2XN48_PRUDU|nr:hypothetical protein Prudu_377S000400 [Prunus dulcis]